MANSADWLQGIGAALKTTGQLGQAHIQDQRAAQRDERMFELQERQLQQALTVAREKNAMMTKHLEKTLASNEKVAGINAKTAAEQGRLTREHETNIANIDAQSRVDAASAKGGGDLEAVTTTGPDGSETTKYFRRDGDTLVEVPMATQADVARAEELRRQAEGGGGDDPASGGGAPASGGGGGASVSGPGDEATDSNSEIAALQARLQGAHGPTRSALQKRIQQMKAQQKWATRPRQAAGRPEHTVTR